MKAIAQEQRIKYWIWWLAQENFINMKYWIHMFTVQKMYIN